MAVDLKRRLSNIRQSLTKSLSNHGDGSFVVTSDVAVKAKEDFRNLPLNNPHREAEILSSIDSVYYSDNNFNATRFELENLPDEPEFTAINSKRLRLREQLSVVTKKISDLILEAHPSYSAELLKVTELQTELEKTLAICAKCRQNISQAQHDSTVASLKVLSLHTKQKRLKVFLEALGHIRTLRDSDRRLRELLMEEGFPGAIGLCLECQRVSLSFKHYKCISELSGKFQDTLASTEEQLDVALSSTCMSLNVEHFTALQTAYDMLGKSKVSAERLVHHFLTAVANVAVNVLEVVGDVSAKQDAVAVEYGQLCTMLLPCKLVSCLLELCKIYWKMMLCYSSVLKWFEESLLLQSSEEIRVFLLDHQKDVWTSCVKHVASLLSSVDIIGFKFDDFLMILKIANTLMELGQVHLNLQSPALVESIRKQSYVYFSNYHRVLLDELRTFLEVEIWEQCPVKSAFSVFDLREFSFLKAGLATANFIALSSTDKENPFDVFSVCASTEDVTSEQCEADSDEDVPEELKREYVDGTNGSAKSYTKRECFKSVAKLPPILCNSSLNVLRLFGRYLHIMTLMDSIAFDIVVSLTQLFDYYLLSIFDLFCRSSIQDLASLNSCNRLSSVINRIRSELLVSSAPDSPIHVGAVLPNFAVSIPFTDKLCGLAERVVAVESVIYLSRQLILLRPHLEKHIPETKTAFLTQFYSQVLSAAEELRYPAYGYVSSRFLSFNDLLTCVSNTNWDINELMSQHSSYVDFLMQDVAKVNQRILELTSRVSVPLECYNVLWEQGLWLISKTLVEGYSNAKRCSNEGRALMQLDFQQLLMKLEQIHSIRPIPGKEFVENYIKAFYMPENSLEQWVKDRKEYSAKQLISLLNVTSHVSKRTRQRLEESLTRSSPAFK